jgi:hypothetical protein
MRHIVARVVVLAGIVAGVFGAAVPAHAQSITVCATVHVPIQRVMCETV